MHSTLAHVVSETFTQIFARDESSLLGATTTNRTDAFFLISSHIFYLLLSFSVCKIKMLSNCSKISLIGCGDRSRDLYNYIMFDLGKNTCDTGIQRKKKVKS